MFKKKRVTRHKHYCRSFSLEGDYKTVWLVNRWNKKGKVTGGQLRMLLSNSEISGRKNICFHMRENLGKETT